MPTKCLLGLELACRNGRRCKRQGSERTGRLHFFYHSPSSTLPVRDVKGEQGRLKFEPHIERNAENYCVRCYQDSIRVFLRSDEKYLFLLTTCKSRKLRKAKGKYFDKKFIVGYIEKAKCLRRAGDRVAAQGCTKLYSFQDAFPLAKLRHLRHVKNFRYMRRDLTQKQTEKVLNHFKGRADPRRACLRALRRLKHELEGKGRTCR